METHERERVTERHRKFYKPGSHVCDLSHACEGKVWQEYDRGCETHRDFSNHCCGTRGTLGDMPGWTLTEPRVQAEQDMQLIPEALPPATQLQPCGG